MDAVPPAVARTKKKRKAAALAAPAATSDNASTAMPPPSTAPATKKGKSTGKKKSAKPIDLRTLPMWVSTANLNKHRIMAIAHEQKWVTGNAGTITGDIINKPLSDRKFYQKGLFGKRLHRATRSTWTCHFSRHSST
jgi:hypothetical protein